MSWLIILMGYLLGSVPTAYLAGRMAGKDIRQVGDLNVGAQNAFRQLGPAIGIGVGLIDFGKGALAVLIARAAGMPQMVVFLAGAAAVAGHNWPVFLGFRGGRGESTTIGILYVLIPIPSIIVTVPAMITLALTRNVIWASVAAFVPLPVVCWLFKVPGAVITYALVLLVLVAITHLLRTRRTVVHRQA